MEGTPVRKRTFKVRPLQGSNNVKEAFRVHVSAAALMAIRMKAGDSCQIEYVSNRHDGTTVKTPAVAWVAAGKIGDNVAQISPILKDHCNLTYGQEIEVSKLEGVLKEDPSGTLLIKARRLGGLNAQVVQVQRIIDRLTAESSAQLPEFYTPSQGVLFYGAKGTGKSALIDSIAKRTWGVVLTWTYGQGQPSPEIVRLPALIVIHHPNSNKDAGLALNDAQVTACKRLFDSIQGKQVLVVAETRHPNNIDESLRAPSYFSTEIELPVPTATGRAEILRAICHHSDQPSSNLLDDVARKTHGYVGADLFILLQTATDIALERSESKTTAPNSDDFGVNGLSLEAAVDDAGPPAYTEVHRPEAQLQITAHDLTEAMTRVRPSALQEVFLETPSIRWSDIGGQHDIKRRLRNAIERPLRQADLMKQLNIRPKKGVLLYGPPGCSKTLMVKALATEAELNFLAVKGAELISMYVGESERAIREVFRKARAASPSIIFFDEIDSIASSRKSELNVLTTLLNEMDGFEELRNVLVVAATNKPQQIDPALMRPGRLDNVIYVGPPDEGTRREILQNWIQKSRVVGVEAADLGGKQTEGFSGAELTSICQTAGEYAMDAGRDHIVREDFERAIDDTPHGITADVLQEYKRWHESRK